jgi:hypothetical protein
VGEESNEELDEASKHRRIGRVEERSLHAHGSNKKRDKHEAEEGAGIET